MSKIKNLLESRGHNIDVLKNDTRTYNVKNLQTAADAIKTAVKNNQHIHVVADYDVDGLMAGSGMYILLKNLGADFTIRFPKKMTEGYGISEKIIDEIPENSLVVTVDNGISAVEAIDMAKAKQLDVIIIDHHQMRGDGLIPEADCIVNPHIFKDEGDFEDYCGAGLVYKLATKLAIPEDEKSKILVLASIATIQDVVPLVDDNRNIVKNGLALLNRKRVDLPGIYSLCGMLKLVPNELHGITEEDYAFQVGPCLNAMGRMLDDGASIAFKNIMHYDLHGEDGIRELVDCNKKRKEETVRQQNILEVMAMTQKTDDTTCMVLYSTGLHEGIIGINAAKVAEKYNMPSIIFTDDETNPDLLKGSARSVDGINIKEALDHVADFIYKYGGHAGAAGLTIERKNLDAFVSAINHAVPKAETNINTWKYDISIKESEIDETYQELRKYAPYGEGFPAPIVKVESFELVKNYGKYYRYIGDNGISFNGYKSEAVSFTLREKYKKYNSPMCLKIVGTLGFSRYSKKPQIMINDFQPVVKREKTDFLL